MEKRKAYSLREVLIVYNFAMVILSAWMAYEFIASALDIPNFDSFVNRCTTSVVTKDYLPAFVTFAGCQSLWKLDTFFFILRKKNNQVSFLHVYHHAATCIFWWMRCKYMPVYFPAALNSFVHAVMYAYYGLSAIGPQMQPYLWWKAHITKLQLIQFVVALIYWGNAIFRCKCVVGFHQISISYSQWVFFVSQFGLFSNFYIQSYLKINKANQGKKD
ncbi:very long chain fatty acid elongase 5-like [Montipora foliosa]|uniref:very long chain fatty acid elongase 5-like n=1 Tax=Montipora foliosa TaxID=591990 RepID=UPI0035F1D35C